MHQVPHTAAALGVVLQLWGQREKEGQLGEGNRGGPGQGDARDRPAAPLPHLPRLARHLLMAAINWRKCEKGKRGSGSSRKKSFRAPVITWTSSQRPSFRSRRSSEASGGGGGNERKKR